MGLGCSGGIGEHEMQPTAQPKRATATGTQRPAGERRARIPPGRLTSHRERGRLPRHRRRKLFSAPLGGSLFPRGVSLERLGGRARWCPVPDPRLGAPPRLREAIKADRATVKEIPPQAAIFRDQARSAGPWPSFTLAGETGDGCLSRRANLQGRRYRCEVYELAVKLVLEGT